MKDTFNTAYLAGDYLWRLNADWGMRFGAQFTHQASVGDELLGDFQTWVVGGRVAASFRGVTGWFAFSRTDDEKGILSPYGSYAGYLSLMQSDFNRADEIAWAVGLSVVPKPLPGWSAFFQDRRNTAEANRGDRSHRRLQDRGGPLARLLAPPSRLGAPS